MHIAAVLSNPASWVVSTADGVANLGEWENQRSKPVNQAEAAREKLRHQSRKVDSATRTVSAAWRHDAVRTKRTINADWTTSRG